MSFTGIGGIPSATTEDGDDDKEGVSIVFPSRRDGRDGMVGVRSGSTGRRGHEVTGEPVNGECAA